MTPVQLLSALINGLSFGALLFLVSSGFTVIFGLMRVLNLAHGVFYLWGGYIGLALLSATGSYTVAALGAALAVAVGGVALKSTLFDRVRGQPLPEVLLTLAVAIVLADIAIAIFGGHPVSVPAPDMLTGAVSFFGATVPRIRIAVILASLAVFIFLWALLKRTRVGAIVRAGVDDREMLEALGVNVHRVSMAVFFVGAALAGISGLVGGAFLGLYPGVDFEILLFALVVVVIGGLGSLNGALLGSALVGLSVSFGTILAPQLLYFVIFGPMLIVLVFRPHGLLGAKL